MLLRACPACKSPLANGGPSCKIYEGLSLFFSRPFSYTLSSNHWSLRTGSLFGKFPRIGNFVFGISNVSLYSIDTSSYHLYVQKKPPSSLKGREDSLYHPYKFN